ncbi:reverse transcriptase RNA-dependent DNA polymerase [Nitzschia inconspicua]|uniref:Reverse transcriptase RNA-dependent DNA polymerase n=1 Tax=Nitzschia inconspicua TaxID=303405 RepID=A0A9K3K6Z9_9STRA|nr:reverse transcriptase RNA-dependent DNA polymerase [Nitzschia inconspicua]KAG7362676.1 reverse transcriptase RNA-dependent DNA polymerase [Nitzschia inconspicua]
MLALMRACMTFPLALFPPMCSIYSVFNLANHFLLRPGSPASRIRSSSKATKNALPGAYLVAINDVLVFTKEQALLEFRKAFDSKSPSLSLTFAPEKHLTLGTPGAPPPGAIILRLHWQYQIKRSGERRSRSCCDGSLRAAPLLHQVASTYSSCVEQPIQQMFFALAAAHDMRVYGGDATDAFAHSPPPETPTFIMIDDAYTEWYKARFGVTLDRNMVLPVLHALQGHPESGRLWETYINKILSLPELSFRSTTHDRTIYSGVFEGEPILLLRQVDDFALACRRESTAKAVYDFIGKALQQPNEAQPPFTYLGLLSDYNGVDVHQTADYIELTSAGYIDRLLRSHGWDTPSPHESSDDRSAPLPVDAVDRLYQSPAGPSEGSPEHADLCDSQGFSYRTLLGELLYAYITCRPDIGYAVVTLSKFASAPHAYHYSCLKGVTVISVGLNTGVSVSPDALMIPLCHLVPPTTFPLIPLSLPFPLFPPLFNSLGAIAYRSKKQTVTATSSTEAEFIAAVSAAKTAKYLRAVLHELSFPQLSPTPIHIDNVSSIQIIYACKPTERSRHIAIQAFAIQDWKDNGDILMHHIPGVINPSDSLTKPTGWGMTERIDKSSKLVNSSFIHLSRKWFARLDTLEMLYIRGKSAKGKVIQALIKASMFGNFHLTSINIIPKDILRRIREKSKENTFACVRQELRAAMYKIGRIMVIS